MIRRLYAVETEARDCAAKDGAPQDRLRLRQSQSAPIQEQIRLWLTSCSSCTVVLPRSPIAQAVGYVLNQWPALIVYTSEEYPELSLRVDDHGEPLAELRRLYEEAQRHFVPYQQFLATRASPAGTYDRAVINAEVARVQAAAAKT